MRAFFCKIQALCSSDVETKTQSLFDKIKALIPAHASTLPIDDYLQHLSSFNPALIQAFIKNVDEICKKHCSQMDCPTELSSKALGINKEKPIFITNGAKRLYNHVVYRLQIAMIARFALDRLNGEEVKKVNMDSKEGLYLCLGSGHSMIYGISNKDPKLRLNFQAEADAFSLYPAIRTTRTTFEEVKSILTKEDGIRSINSELEEDPYGLLIRIDVPLKEFKQACKSVGKIPDKIPGKTIGWGYSNYSRDDPSSSIPSQRNCYAFVYSTLLHFATNKDLQRTLNAAQAEAAKSKLTRGGGLE
ncbi:MAG: hypothetical protein ACYCQI_14605 [Gammaproteobacteria bacterium]